MSLPDDQRLALVRAQLDVTLASARLAKAKAVLAQREAEYGQAMNKLNRVIRDITHRRKGSE